MESEPHSSEIQPSSAGETPIIIQNQDNQINTIILANPDVIDSLANKAPKELLEYAEKNDQRQYQFAIDRSEKNFKLELRRDDTVRLAIFIILGIILSFLIYSAVTGDKTLPDSLIKFALGFASGLGISSYFKDRKN